MIDAGDRRADLGSEPAAVDRRYASIDLTPFFSDRVYVLLRRLEDAGHEAFLVGGAVRDGVLGLKSTDMDIATSATPDEIKSALDPYKLILIGARHGTVRVVLPDLEVDITTYRVESGYSDHRRPDEVVFTRHLVDDLSRRDFTMNAMAFHPKRGLYDPFDGIGSLERRRIEAVGSAAERLGEDYLRALRALRFAARFDFELEPALADAVRAAAGDLVELPSERTGREWSELLLGPAAGKIFAAYRPVLLATLRPGPEARIYRAWRSLEKLPAGDRLRCLAFFLALDLPDSWLNTLVMTKEERRALKQVLAVVRDETLREPVPDEARWRVAFARYGVNPVFTYIRLAGALTDEEGEARWLELLERLERWAGAGVTTLGDLALDGHDLAELIAPRLISEASWRLFTEVASGRLDNDRKRLRAAIDLWYNT